MKVLGVFATHDIASGTQLFPEKFSPRKMKVKDVPPEFRKYCIFLSDEECLCPQRFDRMSIGWYINHSDTPNVGQDPEKGLITLRAIKAGEEIVMNYNELNEPEHLKETYYSKKSTT